MKRENLIVCINDQFSDEQIAMIPNRPVRDEYYVVREVSVTRNGKAVWLEEISNPPLAHPSGMGTFEPSFSIERFRVVDDAPVKELVEEAQMSEVG